MRLIRQIYLAAGIISFLTISLLVLNFAVSIFIKDKVDAMDKALEIEKVVSSLNILHSEYLLFREERMIDQWQSTFDRGAVILYHSKFEEIQDLKRHYIKYGKLSLQVRRNNDLLLNLVQIGELQLAENARLLEQTLLSDLLITSNSALIEARILVSKNLREVNDFQQFTNVFTNILIMVLTISVILFAVMLGNEIIRPIEVITKSNREIISGNVKKAGVSSYKRVPEEISFMIEARQKMLDYLEKNREKLILQKNVIEKKVQERTGELQTAIDNLLKSKNIANQIFMNTSHELKTPLTPINTISQMLEKGKIGKITKKQKANIRIIIRNVNRLTYLIDEILEISRFSSGTAEPYLQESDLSSIVSDVVKEVSVFSNSKNIKIVNKITHHKIMCDRKMMHRMFSNLIMNSIKFTNKGSIHIDTKLSKGNCIIYVRDTGIGMKQDDLLRVFDPFYQVKPSYLLKQVGTGLGLSIVKDIVNIHAGKVWIKSKIGKGTTIFVSLPTKYLYNVKIKK